MLNRLTERTAALRKHYRERYSEETFHYRAIAYDNVMKEEACRNIALAKGLRHFLETKRVDLSREDLLAGHGQFLDWKYSNPEYYEEIERLRQRKDLTEAQEDVLNQVEAGMRMRLYSRYPGGHLIPGYDKLLQIGLGALIERVKHARTTWGKDRKAEEFYEAALIALDGAQKNILRYAEEAGKMMEAECAGSEAYRRLARLEAACRKVAYEPPEHFFEALQLLWLAHEVTVSEQVCGSLSLGRIDQYLYPFYKNDKEKGLLTEEEAEEFIQAFWLKVAGLPKGFQNVTLGGMDADGQDRCNELTFMCLEASRLVRTDQPAISLRVHPNTPDEIWDEAMRVLETGIGFPALFYDPVIISCCEKKGASKQEAVNYGIVGCVEPAIPGREYGHTEGFRINWPKILELMLFGGDCPVTGEHFELKEKHELSEFRTFSEFYKWLQIEFANVEKTAVEYLQMVDAQYGSYWPAPYVSCLMDGCIEKGKDVNDGGTIYNMATINATGMANLVDSLVAIRDGIFQKGWISLEELPGILKKDFRGYEELRNKICRLPKYGNDIEDVDALYKELAERFVAGVQGYRNPRGGGYQIGFYSVENHVIMGKMTGATPDGRRAGTALANSTSPVQGMESAGPTAVIRSVLHTPMQRSYNGVVLDLKFHPAFFKNKRQKQAIRMMTETFFEQGGQEIQFNVVDKETLLSAKEHPKEYQDLIVRVSGFSAFFVSLDEATQNEIIARAEYQEVS